MVGPGLAKSPYSELPADPDMAKSPSDEVPADPGLAKSPFGRLPAELRVRILEYASYNAHGIEFWRGTDPPRYYVGKPPTGIQISRTCKTFNREVLPAFFEINVFYNQNALRKMSSYADDLIDVRDWLRKLGPHAQKVRTIEAHQNDMLENTTESFLRYLKTRSSPYLLPDSRLATPTMIMASI